MGPILESCDVMVCSEPDPESFPDFEEDPANEG